MRIRIAELKELIREAAKGAAKGVNIDRLFQDLEELQADVEENASEEVLAGAIGIIQKDVMASTDMRGNPFGLDASELYYFEDAYKFFCGRRIRLGTELLKAMRAKINSEQKSDGDIESLARDAKIVMQNLVKMSAALSKFNDAEEEAPEDAPLGRFAFPTKRRNVPLEVDTPKEKKLFDALYDHFVDNIKLNPKEAAQIQELIANGWYQEVFSPPDQEEVYRGMAVPAAWLAKALGLKDVKDIPSKGTKEVKMKYTPKGGASSWTVSKAIGNKFSESTGRYAILLHADVADNPDRFVTGPGHLYKLDNLAQYAEEKEVVGLGQIKVYKISWRDRSR